MAVSEDEIRDEFEVYVNIISDEMIEKLLDLCTAYQLNAASIADQWVAFATSNRGVELEKVTMEALGQMEREITKRKVKTTPKTPASKIKNTEPQRSNFDSEDAFDLVDGYTTPKLKGIKRQHTPDNANNKRLSSINRTPSTPFSPSNFSPISSTPSQSQTYQNRDKKGEVVCSHGAKDIDWQNIQNSDEVSIEFYNTENLLSKKFKYMFQKHVDKAVVMNTILEETISLIKEEHNLPELASVAHPMQENITIAGRIKCDGQGRLNSKSIILEGSIKDSNGRCMPVDVSGLTDFSFFPGMIVAFEGVNITGKKFVAQKYYHCSPPLQVPKDKIESALHIIIACGPFATTESLNLEPLGDLMSIVQRDRPDVCILMGPFVDSKSEVVQNLVEKTYGQYFEEEIKAISNAVHGLHTQVVIVPSCRDIHHDFIFPQPPFEFKENKFDNVHFLPDPSTVSVNGVVIGITSNDILFHLGSSETSYPSGSSDRMKKLSQHVLQQRMFYPLYPPGDDVNIEFDKFRKHALFNATPHIMILPSDLRYFVKDCFDCCCINPSRLAKNKTGGTYGRIYVPLIDSTKPLMEQVSAQILKI